MAAHIWLGENLFTRHKVLGLLLALSGLLLIFINQLLAGSAAVKGVLFMVASATLFSISSVWVKRLGNAVPVHAFDQTIGTMACALPGLFICWYLLDCNCSIELSVSSLWSLLYLALVASVLGFVAFFYVLNHLGGGPVSLIPLITPVLALWIGAVMAGEMLTPNIVTGTLLILSGLVVYEGLIRLKAGAS